jgi:hypothetical protein
MTLEEFLTIVNGACPVEWRRGQFFFNTLEETRPDLAELIRGTFRDPFYYDTRIPAAVSCIAQHWDVDEDERACQPAATVATRSNLTPSTDRTGRRSYASPKRTN